MKINLKTYELKKGAHANPEAGLCAMEMVAYLAKEPHSDSPQCTCPTLGAYVRQINDVFNDDERQLLKPFIKKLIGTRDGKSLERAKLLAYRAGHIFAPIAAEIAGRADLADLMRDVKEGDWEEQEKTCQEVRDQLRKVTAYAAAYVAYAAARAAATTATTARAATHAAAAATYTYAIATSRRVVKEAIEGLRLALEIK